MSKKHGLSKADQKLLGKIRGWTSKDDKSRRFRRVCKHLRE